MCTFPAYNNNCTVDIIPLATLIGFLGKAEMNYYTQEKVMLCRAFSTMPWGPLKSYIHGNGS